MEGESASSTSFVDAVENETPRGLSQFQINRDFIDSVPIENQSEELRALGITVYDQSKFEEGILRQVDDALEEQERQKKAVAAKKLLVSKDVAKEKVADVPPKVQQETEREKMVRLGQMTPFGTVLGSEHKTDGLSGFEKYLLEQEKLRSDKAKLTSKKGKALKSSVVPVRLSPGEHLAKRVTHSHRKTTKTSSHKKSSDSEYVPSDEKSPKAKASTVQKKRRKKDVEENCNTDDSNWEYSEDEDTPKKRKTRNTGRVIDDGNMGDYRKRLAEFSNLPMENEDCEEFEGGYRIPLSIWSRLYNYQKVGVRWMYELRLQRCGGILGDEMGLGKTIQVVAFLAGLAHSKLITRLSSYRGLGPVLLITPATVMHQWVKEFHKWYPPLRVAILHESGSYSGSRHALIKSINSSNGVLITSYTSVPQCSECLLGLDWDYIILDEGHKIRNPDAQATLVVKQFRTSHRFILSGSPMQNNLKELWSLFDFVFPGKLGTLPVFLQQFAVPITQGGYANASQVQVATAYKCATVLRDTINPYLLRRMKADVKDHLQLPDKNEQVLFCRLTQEQRQLYQNYLDSGEIKSIIDGRLQIFVGLTNLRKICNHPDLFDGGPPGCTKKNDESDPKKQFGCVERSGKLLVIESLLKIWKEQDHRVLLFSQSRKMLDILEVFVQQQSYTYLRLDGTTSIGSRQPMIEKYNQSPDIFVFLLTTRVGGLGVNLTGANRVIIYDPDWNPSTDSQARERSWRIGQQKAVTVYRLLTSGTIEEKIYHRQIFKQYLTNRVLKDPKQRRFFKSNDLYELFTLKETDNQCTETEAIFAGTGSEVATNPNPQDGPGNGKADKPTDDEWMRKWKKEREKRELEWKKSLEKRKKEKETMNETEDERKKRKKREAKEKKERKRIKIDGAKVKNVIKMSSHNSVAVDVDEGSTPSTSGNQDDYVLQRLFAKTGVMSALRHDSIIDAGNPDYALIEGEAERVAKEAVQVLKSSRRNCWTAEAGVPTWTGTSGALRSSTDREKPRFGAKKKTVHLSVNASTSAHQSEISSNPSESIAACSGIPGSSTAVLSSRDLLSRMQARNRLLGLPGSAANEPNDSAFRAANEEESMILQTDAAPLEFAVGVDYHTMTEEIRSFVAFRGVTPGQAFTTDLLNEFDGKLPLRGAPLFRAILNQLCTFTRDVHNQGIWQLKPEFQ
ncbi:hypothetical protein OUZ56_007831 [Daphnia magna]|uniref:DNA repair and recombination protein RAD54-like n=1 Tax=Daphnia magna TaxID=35525 RepID=A0ABR0ABF9_9CRUS|nr:hypothetical protein OUZ56_007831 [Daphnia magna]